MERSIIRLLTCGSVDDGKSTLIGRLLVETDSIPHDTIDSTRNVRRSGSTIAAGEIDFSLLTDGLEAEREQGITIDVAYRSMSLLDGKRLIISDAPGHEQYTRNMAVAASRADIALVLVDATKGVRTQTLRHLTICSLMGISRVIVAINKLDAMNYSQSVFEEIRGNVQTALTRMHLDDVLFIPLSALAGDNVVQGSVNMGWYEGQTLLESIQEWRPAEAIDVSARMRIQLISRAENFRGVSGTVHRGSFTVGDEVKIFPSNQSATIAKIITYKKEIQSAHDSEAVTLLLEPEVDATRGDLIAASKEELHPSDRFNADIVWLHEDPLIHSRSYLLIAGSSQTPATVTRIRHKIDVNSGSQNSATNLGVNEIGSVEIATDAPLTLLPYLQSREFGNFILVDRLTFRTVGAGMIRHSLRRGENVVSQKYEVNKAARALQKNQKAQVIWLTGLSGSGKSTIANGVEKRLHALEMHPYVLDGDNLRMGLNADLGFTPEDRAENVRRISEVAKVLVDAGLIVLVAVISPFEADRQRARSLFDEGEFLEVYVDTPVEVCVNRDPKGLYKKASKGEIPNFTGIGQNYEVPKNPDLHLKGDADLGENIEKVMKHLF
ncbi:MAG: adenylyl-sulfate kinase [Actinomycetales bacterium]|nr:MAG: adenylyl-sulfate kinase [Actinomycetales bacterium]